MLRFNRKIFIHLFFFLVILSIICMGCKNKENTDKKLEIFTWWTTGGEVDGLNEMYKIYKRRYPDIEIVNAVVAGGAGINAKAVLKTRMQEGDPPDSFQVHAGRGLIESWVVLDKIEPITFIFKENNNFEAYPKGLIDIISYKGEIFSVPVNIHRSNVLWYNKKIFNENGLTPPQTIEELFKLSETLKAKGITPIALGDKEIWVAVHILENILLGIMGEDNYKGLWNTKKLWKNPDIEKVLINYVRMMKFVNKDHSALDWQGASQYIIDGKCAMMVMGDWAEGYFKSKGLTPNKEFGWKPFPDTSGAFLMLSDSFCVPKNAKNRNAAINWLALCASKEGQDAFNPQKGSIPARVDTNENLYDEYLASAMRDFKKDIIVPSVAHGATASEVWLKEIESAMASFLSDLNIEKAFNKLSEIAEKNIK